MSRLIAAFIFPLLVGCISLPTRTPPPLTYDIKEASLGSAVVAGCDGSFGEGMPSDVCLFRLTSLANMLSELKIFSSVTVGSSETADYLISVKVAPHRPYQMSLGHNPAVLLLSTVIPFWQKTDYGVELDFTDARSGETYNVSTLYEAHDIYWSGAIFLNLFSDRGLSDTHVKSEHIYLRNSIVNALAANSHRYD